MITIMKVLPQQEILNLIKMPARFDRLIDRTHEVLPKEMELICTLVKYINPKEVFEFGTYKGYSANMMAMNCSCPVYTLDKERYPYYGEYEMFDNVHRIIADSIEYTIGAETQIHASDFIFVDGGHDYNTLANDSRKAFAMKGANLKKKPVAIVWHDYNTAHFGVTRYLNELNEELITTGYPELMQIDATSLVIYSENIF